MERYEQIIAPTGNPVTTAEAKTFLNIDHSSDDTLIASLITTATRLYEIRTNRQLVTALWRLHLDDFPTSSKLPVWIKKAPMDFVRSISYISATDEIFSFLGEDDGYQQEIDITPANVQIGDVFTVYIAGISMATFTATAATVANVTAGLVANWATATNPSRWKEYIGFTDQTTHVKMLTNTAGIGFDVTTTATNVTAGVDAQTLTATYITPSNASYKMERCQDRFSRIFTLEDVDWPDISDMDPAVANAANNNPQGRVRIDFAAGYGAAGDVPEIHKTAIKQIVADLYEHRGMMTEKELFHSKAYERLEWAGKVPEFA